MCQKCNKKICCCEKIISKTGKRGPIGPTGKTGPQGPQGPAGSSGGQVVFQSAFQGDVTGNIFPNHLFSVGTNMFSPGPVATYILWIDFGITSDVTHTVTFYFKKNGVMVGESRTKTLGLSDHVNFKTSLLLFSSTDTVEFFISSSSSTASITTASVHSLKQ